LLKEFTILNWYYFILTKEEILKVLQRLSISFYCQLTSYVLNVVVRCDIQIKNYILKNERHRFCMHCVPIILLLRDSENDLYVNFPMAKVWK